MRLWFLLPFLLSAPVLAQGIETVTATANGMAGLWKIHVRTQYDKGLNCRLERARTDPALYCFERPENAALTLKDGKVRIAWHPTLAQSNVIDATMTSADSFAGGERVLMMGITFLHSEDVTGTRLTVQPDAADQAGKAPLLRALLSELAQGRLSHPYDADKVQLPHDIGALGAVTAISYMNTVDSWRDGRNQPDFFSLYLVQFEKSQRFCGLHQREDGVLDGFRCV